MGATTQKSIKNIIESKYSFSHPKSDYPLQISVWKFCDEELESMAPLEGTPLKWPFKFYSDEGYIMALIQNRAKEQLEDKKTSKHEPWELLKELKATLNLMEILYSFSNAEIEEYFCQKITIESENKYLKDKLNLWIYVFTGQNLVSVAKLRLMSHAIAFERYISRGGLCSISKLYHQFEQIADLSNELRLDGEENKVREEDYYVAISSLAEDKIKCLGQENKQTQKQILTALWDQFQKYDLLIKVIFSNYLQVKSSFVMLMGAQNSCYPKVDGQAWAKNHQLLLVEEKKERGKEKMHEPVKQKEADLNDSSPFQCQITEINFKEKKKGAFMNEESNLIEDLSVLNQKKGAEFFKIVCPEEENLILTNYSSLRQYKQILELNVRLVINLAPTLCFNYYLNDLEYLHYYLAALPHKNPADAVLFQNNIQHILLPVTQNIINYTVANKPKDPLNNYVLIHSQSSLFSDQNCTVVIGYLIIRYLYTYQKAFALLSQSYCQYKGDKLAKLSIHKLYADQLLNLEGRVLIASSPDYGVSLNHSFWRTYQISNNHSSPGQTLIPRFVGQLTNPSQLTSLPNHNRHFYIVLSNQLVATLSVIVERWQKDPAMKIPGGVTGIKVLVGKQFEFRDIYVHQSRAMIPLILKFELINRHKCQQSFNNEFLLKFIQDLVNTNLQVENIQKSFRKAAPFTPLYSGFEEEGPIGPKPKIPLPHNPKEKLTFKYPFLRPVWECLKDDEYYFIVQVTKGGASVQIVKGKNWAGYQVDKQQFFARIVECYLHNIQEDKIWIAQEGEQSLFGQDLNL